MLLTHDAALGAFEELDDLTDLGAIGHLILDLVDNIEDTRLTMEQQTIGVSDVLLYFLVDSSLLHHRRVRTSIREGLAACNDKRGDVARERSTSLYQCQTTNTGVGILDGRTGENDSVLNLAVASNLHTITKHAMIAYDGIVADMSSFEQEIVIADHGAAITIGTTVDDDILTDDIIITNLHIRLLTTEIKILREGSYHTALVDLVVLADTRAVADADEGEDDAIVTDLHIVFNIHEGEYLTVVADLRLWGDLGLGGYFACHNYSLFTIHYSIFTPHFAPPPSA